MAFEYANNHHQTADNDYKNVVIAAGGSVVTPRRDEVQLDLDTQEQYDALPYKLAKFKKITGANATVWTDEFSPSGAPHRHVTLIVELPIRSELERIALQLYFGSDANRELHNLCRDRCGVKEPSAFFQGVSYKKLWPVR